MVSKNKSFNNDGELLDDEDFLDEEETTLNTFNETESDRNKLSNDLLARRRIEQLREEKELSIRIDSNYDW